MTSKVPPWDAVIVNFQTSTDIPDCVAALRAARPAPATIIVVDNASSDNSGAILARVEGIRLVTNPENLGFAGGVNSGIAVTSAPFVASINPDIQIAPDWPAVLLAAFQHDDRLGSAGGKLLYPDGTTIQCAGCGLHMPRMIAYTIGRGERDTGQYDTIREVDSYTSAALFLRRATLDTVGLFDDRFFPAYYADVDLGYRIWQAGWTIRYYPAAVAIHRETITHDQTNPRHRVLSSIQRTRFVLKHLNRQQFLTEFLPAEDAAFAADSGYIRKLESDIEEIQDYARKMERDIAEIQPYARNLEAAVAELQPYARRLESALVELQAYTRQLEQRVAAVPDAPPVNASSPISH